jgi:DNA polymerase-1
MILQVHDELLFEAPPAEVRRLGELVRREMEGAFPMDVPLRVEVKVGENWRDMTVQTR